MTKTRLQLKHKGKIYNLKISYTENRASRGHHGKKFKRTLTNIHFGVYKTNKSHETSKDFTENNELGNIIEVIENTVKGVKND